MLAAERNLKRIFMIIISITAIIITINTLSVSAEKYTKYADILYELKLFKGMDTGYELDKPFTREQAAAMMVRLSGNEKESFWNGTYIKFDDVANYRWSYPYIMFCVDNGIVKGTSDTTFAPAREISSKEFMAMLLRLLGYEDTEPENAFERSYLIGLINSQKADELEKKERFTRDDMVYVCYRCLNTKSARGTLMCRALKEKGILSKEQADKIDYTTGDDVNKIIDNMIE